jgi:RHH-type proline utilization regulon transcriptional repressor/proline dehydrogenase/delta 1-pyrroline-5-carboxylate dehydrogenase
LKGAQGEVGTWQLKADPTQVQLALSRLQVPQTSVATQDLPGPTGESNRLSQYSRGVVLCLGPGAATASAQAQAVRASGGVALEVTGLLAPEALVGLQGFAAVVWWGSQGPYQRALAERPGPILPLIAEMPDASWVLSERHVCIDTTASGGNAQLLAEVAD